MADEHPWLIVQVEEQGVDKARQRPTTLARREATLAHLNDFLLQRGYVPVRPAESNKRQFKVKAWLADACCTPPAAAPQQVMDARMMKLGETLERLESFAKSSWTHRPKRKDVKKTAVTAALLKARVQREKQRTKAKAAAAAKKAAAKKVKKLGKRR